MAFLSTGLDCVLCPTRSAVLDDDAEYECLAVLSKHTQDVKHVKWHPEKEVLASCGYDDVVHLYRDDPQDWLCYDTLKGHESTVWKIAFSPSGDDIATASADGTVRLWHMYPPGNKEGHQNTASPNDPTWICTRVISGVHEREVYTIDWGTQGWLATGCGDNTLRVFHKVAKNGGAEAYEVLASVENAHAEVGGSMSHWCGAHAWGFF